MIPFIILFSISFYLGTTDCPLSYYPTETVLGIFFTYSGFISAELDNDPSLHDVPNEYSYPLDEPFKSQ